MPDTIKDGGPAFPVHPNTNPAGEAAGMSLRDWFATQVSGLSEDASPTYCEHLTGRPMPSEAGRAHSQWWAEADAAYRYIQADAMLGAREAR